MVKRVDTAFVERTVKPPGKSCTIVIQILGSETYQTEKVATRKKSEQLVGESWKNEYTRAHKPTSTRAYRLP